MADVTVTGIDALFAKIDSVVRAAENAADDAIGRGAEAVAAEAARLAPKVTGELAGSYTHEREAPGVWLAGTNLWRAHFSEFGTKYQTAKPHLFPAYESLRNRIATDIFASRVRAAILAVAA